MIVKAGTDGINKIITQFVAAYPSMSKRQIEKKVSEIAVKERRGSDTAKVWHMLPEFEHYLYLESTGLDDHEKKIASTSTSTTTTTSNNGTATATTKKRKKTDDITATADDDGDEEGTGGGGVDGSSKKPVPKDKGGKGQGRTSSSSDMTKNTAAATARKSSTGGGGSGTPVSKALIEPKKARRAFWYFVKENRSKFEDEMGLHNTNDEDEIAQLKERLSKEWTKLDPKQRSELKVFLAAGGVQGAEDGTSATPGSDGSRIKKRKKE
eukprot:gene5791-11693_t